MIRGGAKEEASLAYPTIPTTVLVVRQTGSNITFATRGWTFLLVHPVSILAVVFLVQAGIWYTLYPESPVTPFAAARFFSPTALLRFSVLATLLLLSTLVTRMTRLGEAELLSSAENALRIRYLQRVASLALTLAVIGELVYVRELLVNPSIIMESWGKGWFSGAGELVSTNKVLGISSLNNLIVVAVAIHGIFAFNSNAGLSDRKRSRKVLFLVGLVMLVHALLLAARMFLVYFSLTLLPAYLLLGKDRKRRGMVVVLLALFLTVGTWTGETLRAGRMYSRGRTDGLFSLATQKYVGTFLLEAYIGNDFNNTMAVMSCEPSYQVVYGTNLRSLATNLGLSLHGFESCSEYNSRYGTMNVLAWWWFDLGWMSVFPAVFLGVFLGLTFNAACTLHRGLSFVAIYYAIAFPGLVSITRINYYGLTIFLGSLALLTMAHVGWIIRNRE